MKIDFLKIYKSRMFSFTLIVIVVSILGGMLYAYFTRDRNRPNTQTTQTTTPILTNGPQQRGVSIFGNSTDISQTTSSASQFGDSTIEEKKKIVSKLPIYKTGFKTSVGITTTINVYSTKLDAGDFMRVEIYGINYNNSEADINNKDYIAFKESFINAKEEIKKAGADPDKIIYIFHNRENIHLVAEGWARSLGLINY